MKHATWAFAARVVIKAALLFVLVNVLFAALRPLDALGRLSLYNVLLPGRERLPYGEDPARAYNLSLNSIPAMLASHVLTRPKADDELRVLLLGDSNTWGWRLTPDETLAGQINAAGLMLADGRRVVAYNLGYPIMSLTKDLLLLDTVMDAQPDLIIWLVTLESFPREKQLYPPIVQHNAAHVRDLIARYGLALNADDARFVTTDFWGETLIGQRRAVADWLRLQFYGVSWAATGIDQHIPAEYTPRQSDFEPDASWQDYAEATPLEGDALAFDVLTAGAARAGDVPLLIVNEPMFISSGQNSGIRYNAFYPRWAYDAYRERLTAEAGARGWNYHDWWDAVPPAEFTDSPVHLTPAGSRQVAGMLAALIQETLDG
jgi:hypothetical protein